MSKPHQHAEFIKAWADGRVIEFKSGTDAWAPLFSIHPFWHPHCQYRVAEPSPITLRYRLCVRKQTGEEACVLAVHDDDPDIPPPGFIRWISEWQEVEL